MTVNLFPKTTARIRSYFVRHTIIISKTHAPSVLICDFTDKRNGHKYVKVKYANRHGMREACINSKNVIEARRSDSKFMIHLRKIGLLPSHDTTAK